MVDSIREIFKDALKKLYEELDVDDTELNSSHMKKLSSIVTDLQSLGARMNIRDFVYLQDVLGSSYNIIETTLQKYHLTKDETKEIKKHLITGLKNFVDALELEEAFEDNSKNIINERQFMEAYKNLIVDTWVIHTNLVVEGRITKEELKTKSIEENDM